MTEPIPPELAAFREEHGGDPRQTSSGIPVEVLYGDAADVDGLGLPGSYPYTRGVHPEMYRSRPWTMRQYAGFSTAAETNERFRYLLKAGQTGLSVAFDLPTQIGYDPDHDLARPEVGKVGVSIATLDDMLELLDGIPLDKVSTSMTINATAVVLLALYAAVGKEQGVAGDALRGTIQNDILKEYSARGTYRFPPRPSLRIITDIFGHAAEHLPRFNTISISGYHMREAGCTAAQECGFTLANGIAYVQAAVDAGLDVDRFARRISFFFNAHNDLFEEVAKFRASRRMWARIMRERFGAKDEKSWALRFHAQTAGSTLTSQQHENNAVRVTVQALAAVLGGTQSLHTNGRDEALGLPTEASAKLALRTQQILACESGVAATVDPLGGAPFVEELTDQLEERAQAIIDEIDGLGGAPAAIEQGYVQRGIMASAYEHQKGVEAGRSKVVGVNAYTEEEPAPEAIFKVDDRVAEARVEHVRKVRADRSAAAADAALAGLDKAARGQENLFPRVLECVEARVTIGEICEALEAVFGRYREVPVL
ncbi:MAG: methylmalonyl-CoA mutase family protein [Planctomycetota bacterium]|nr:methylmalonyl-CoA mutase family protein [Planctomycetota bacterium]